MATTTPNFGWPVPTSTDLVKDGATAIEALGDGIDASLVDLKGGLTGQVLAKTTNTDMDFTWVTTDDTNAIQNAIVDAKGDLIAATANDTPARLAVGNNGETLVADSSTSTGLRYTALFGANKNKIINGDFNINQRAFTSNTTNLSYNFDRWTQINGGTSGTLTVTPQTFTPGAAPVAGYEGANFVQCVTASGADTNTFAIFAQRIEDVRTYAGQTVTVSFWAKATSGAPKIAIEFEQNFGSGGSPSTAVTAITGGAVTLSTSFARYSVTVAVPTISGKTIGSTANTSYLELNLWTSSGATNATRASSIGIQNFTASIWGVQVEYGSKATPFQTATGTLQGELAACRRYLPFVTGRIFGYSYATNASYVNYRFDVPARVAPTGITLLTAAASMSLLNSTLVTGAPTAVNFNDATAYSANIAVTTTAGTPTIAAGQGAALETGNGILFTGCEL